MSNIHTEWYSPQESSHMMWREMHLICVPAQPESQVCDLHGKSTNMSNRNTRVKNHSLKQSNSILTG